MGRRAVAEEEQKTSPNDAAAGAEAELRLEQEASASLGKENRRIVIAGAVLAVCMIVVNFTPLRAWLTDVQVWKRWIDGLGFAAHGAFAAMCLIAVMMGVPRLPLCGLAGVLFGFMEGLAASWLGTAAGSYGAFLLARWGGRKTAAAQMEKRPWLEALMRAPSLLRVFWVRQLMVPGMMLNVMFGLTAVRHRIFLAGTLLGYLPLNIAFTLVGSGLGKEKLAHTLVQILAAMAVVNIIAWIVLRLVKRHQAETK